MRTAAMTLAVLTASCSSDRFLELPKDGTTSVKTWVGILIGAGEPGPAIVSSGAEGPLRLMGSGGNTTLYLLGYDAAGSELGPASAACRACGFTMPSRSFVSTPAGWSALTAPPDEALDALVPDRSTRCARAPECPRLSYTELWIPGTAPAACAGGPQTNCTPAFAVGWSDGSAYWAARSGQGFELRADGVSMACSLPFEPLDGWRNRLGDLWVLSASNQLHRLWVPDLTRAGPCPVAEVVDGPAGARIRNLAVGDGTSRELFALTSSRTFARYDGNQWTTAYTFPKINGDGPGRLVWLGPGHALAVMDTAEVAEWSDGAVALRRPLGASNASITAIGQAKSGRLLVSIDGFGMEWADRPTGPWTAVPGTHSLHYGRALFAWEDLILLSSGSGIDVYQQDHGLCPEELAITGRTDPTHIVPLDAETALIAETGLFDGPPPSGGLQVKIARRAISTCP